MLLSETSKGGVMADYGRVHKALRRRLLAAYVPGITRCARCGLPIVELDTSRIHLDHADDGRSYLGLCHKFCNEQAGGRIGAAITNAKVPGNRYRRPRRRRQSRVW
jgi:hypothetical protein